MRCSCMMRASEPGSFSRDSTSVAPENSAPAISQTETSKPSERDWTMRSSGVMWESRNHHDITATTARCGTITPLGEPVEPDV